MSSTLMPYEPQCTYKCRSQIHADEALSAITKGGLEGEEVVINFLQYLCPNHAQLTDRFGRTALHLAASCGKGKVVRWLLSNKSCRENTRDWESGWTPLHRSLFYGQLFTASILIEYGASLTTLDHEYFTPINIVRKDLSNLHINYTHAGVNEVYVWGINHNYNLGLGSSQSRSSPELMDAFRKANINVEKIVMCKFHTLFLSRGGRIYACGQGYRGRLGIPVEKTLLEPQLIRSVAKDICVQIAAGTDHSVLLMQSGSVWTCGSNEYHQLGHVPPPDKLSTPKMITGLKNNAKNVVGICAGRFHTVVCFRDVIYTFGLNAGQLGHLDQRDHLQTTPRAVSSLLNEKIEFTHIATSHAATCCVTKMGDIFVLHRYQCRKIASKQTDILKLVVHGGTLDSKALPNIIKEGGGTELRILVLKKGGRIYTWDEVSAHLTPCILSINRNVRIIDVGMFNSGLILASDEGEGFLATMLPPKVKKIETKIENPRAKPVADFIEWIETDECFHLKLKSLPNIHRAVSVSCDYKGRNFAILQAHPKSNLTDIPQLSPSQIKSNLREFLLDTAIDDGIQDCLLKVGKSELPAHKYILASRCKVLESLMTDHADKIVVEQVHWTIVKDILEYLYTDSCRWLINGSEIPKYMDPNNSKETDLITNATNKKHKKKSEIDRFSSQILKLLKEAAKNLKLINFLKRLEAVEIVDDRINILDSLPNEVLKFDRVKFPNLSDVTITSQDGKILKCHKCILVARSDYFRSMLSGFGWRESSSVFTLPVPGNILDIVLDFLYSNESTELSKTDNVEFLCNVLVTADKFLISSMKESCEMRLTELLSLKNAPELLEIAWIYNASQLKSSAMQFIGLNIPAMLEMKCLSLLGDEILMELTKYYRQLIPQMCYRVVTPYESPPSFDEMQIICQKFSPDTVVDRKELINEKKKRRTQKKVFNNRKSESQIQESTVKQNELLFTSLKLSDSETSLDGSFSKISPLSPVSVPSLRYSISESQCSSSPPMTSHWFNGDEDMNDAFPDLSCEMKPESSSDKTRHSNDFNNRNKVKLSQKQRKKLQNCPTPIPNSLFMDNISKTNAWKKVSLTNSVTPLSEIMQHQLRSNVEVISQEVKEQQVDKTQKEKASHWNTNVGEICLSKPTKYTGNKDGSRNKVCFSSILKEEQQQADYLAKCQSKSLHYIQLEDQAIEDLLTFYNAQDNPEEFICVQRVLPKFTSIPLWKQTSR